MTNQSKNQDEITTLDCKICSKIVNNTSIRQHHDGTWPDTNLGLVDHEAFKMCPLCGTCFSIRFHEGGMFSDDEIELTRLNSADSKICRLLIGDATEQDIKNTEVLLENYFHTNNPYALVAQVDLDLKPIVPVALKYLKELSSTEVNQGTVISLLHLLRRAVYRGTDLTSAVPTIECIRSSTDRETQNLAIRLLQEINNQK